MWPIDEKLKNQNALEKYRRWLRRWLLDDRREKEPAPGRLGGRFKSVRHSVNSTIEVELTECLTPELT